MVAAGSLRSKRGSHAVGSRRVQESKANLFNDEKFMHRLKQKNYGKWYMRPNDFANKIKLLNTELTKMQEMNN